MSEFVRKGVTDIEKITISPASSEEKRAFRQAVKVSLPQRAALKGNWGLPGHLLTEDEAVSESRRCIFCADAMCNEASPTETNVKEFVHAVGERNFYYASKILLSSNPLALSTSRIMSGKETSTKACQLEGTAMGSIHSSALASYALDRFREYRIPQILSPTTTSRSEKIAVLGSGPEGLSAGSFLARLGYSVEIFDSMPKIGGIMTNLVPTFVLPKEDVEFELESMKQIGVKFSPNVNLGKDIDFGHLQSNFDAILLTPPFCKALLPDSISEDAPCEVISAVDFLSACREDPPDLEGKRVMVVGGSAMALYSARAAFRCGAASSAVITSSDIQSIHAEKHHVTNALQEGVSFRTHLQYESIDKNGLHCVFTEKNELGELIPLTESVTLKPDVVIMASRLAKACGACGMGEALKQAKNVFLTSLPTAPCLPFEMQVNVGHEKALEIHKFFAEQRGEELPEDFEMPMYHTPVDNVDLSSEFLGMHFSNPFGLSSAPVSGEYECISNAFRAGFGWTVTKTFALDKDLDRNNDIRIVKSSDDPGCLCSYQNICGITERSCEYWLKTIRRLKRIFPGRPVVASIMCTDSKEDWQTLAQMAEQAGADALELNLSCPNDLHGDAESGGAVMAMALGVIPDSVERITRYVVEAVEIPVFTKLTPNVTSIEEIARAAIRGGGHLALINTVSGFPKIFQDGTPFPQVGREQRVISGGLSGDQIRPIALRDISLARKHCPDAGILGIGGIRSGLTALQLLYAGANVLQMCSVVQRYSYEVVREMISAFQFVMYSWSRPDLRALLSAQGEQKTMPFGMTKERALTLSNTPDRPIPKLTELVGYTQKFFGVRSDMDTKWTAIARVDPKKCIACGSCITSCRDNSVQAIVRHKDRVVINPMLCCGCALCLSVCPAEAISMKEFPKVREMHPHPEPEWAPEDLS
eukprot:gnl/Chilomastix_cuspidata/362.p1 GENE.gnl/Chilomastix_cuspidata/362~~gnl/Chilomastix_cuspidata/362.p1  ORF type:complete len:930 (+),score=129.90 gnl/Chilomastix_cuspidata/362:48-2837(+)